MKGEVYVFSVSYLLFIFLMVSGEYKECRLCESLLNEDDHCTFLLDESTETPPWSCPAVFPCGHIISINYTFLMDFHAIHLQRITKCRKFVIVTQNFTRYSDFFSGIEIFSPYTEIVLLESGNDTPYEFSKGEIYQMYANALHVLQVYQTQTSITIKNIITGMKSFGNRHSIPNVNTVLREDHLHPLLDNDFSMNVINVSLFHCPPFVIDKDPTNKTQPSIDTGRFDGVEYRLMTHITKKWNRRFFVRNPSPDALDSWEYMLDDLVERRTNIAMCGLWLVEELEANFEISDPYEQQCITLLVPRIKPIPRNQYVYLALTEQVWYIYLIFLLVIPLLIYYFVTVNTHHTLTVQFNLLTRFIMDIIAIATQHGITIFPKRFSAKILIMSWFFFSILISAIFSTGYTSILTTSLFPKPIDNISDLIGLKLRWGDEFGEHLKNQLVKSGNMEFAQFAELMINSDTQEAKDLMYKDSYAQTVAILSSKFVAGTEKFENVSSNYRTMRSCIYKFYTVFAFQNNSPYVALFTKEIPKYIESGLIHYWMKLTNFHYGKHYVYSFSVLTKDKFREPQSLSIQNITTGLYLWGCGLAIATAVFILELLYFKYKMQKKSHRLEISNNYGLRFREQTLT